MPTGAATAWYHLRRWRPEQKRKLTDLLREVEAFAASEYSAALFAGASLSAPQRAMVADKLARYTGLSREYGVNHLRINIHRFCKAAPASGGDGGAAGFTLSNQDRDSAGETFEFDPAHANLLGAYGSTLNDYVRRDLAFESDLPYHTPRRALSKLGLEGFLPTATPTWQRRCARRCA